MLTRHEEYQWKNFLANCDAPFWGFRMRLDSPHHQLLSKKIVTEFLLSRVVSVN
jgi:hypothetical protein